MFIRMFPILCAWGRTPRNSKMSQGELDRAASIAVLSECDLSQWSVIWDFCRNFHSIWWDILRQCDRKQVYIGVWIRALGTLERFIKETSPFACSHRDLLISETQTSSNVVCPSIVTALYADWVGALWVGLLYTHRVKQTTMPHFFYFCTNLFFFKLRKKKELSIVASLTIWANLHPTTLQPDVASVTMRQMVMSILRDVKAVVTLHSGWVGQPQCLSVQHIQLQWWWRFI